jgi:hypothetical protein
MANVLAVIMALLCLISIVRNVWHVQKDAATILRKEFVLEFTIRVVHGREELLTLIEYPNTKHQLLNGDHKYQLSCYVMIVSF